MSTQKLEIAISQLEKVHRDMNDCVNRFILKDAIDQLQEQVKLFAIPANSRTFEYRVVNHDMFDEDEIQLMNSMGSKGWEIIRILEPMKWVDSDGLFVRIYHKREKLS